jgi:hypothetical protein
LRPVLRDLLRQLGRDLAGLALAVAVGARVAAHVEDVDDSAQLVLRSDRQVDGGALVPELRPELLEDPEEVRPLAVEHVHEDDAREAELFGTVPVPRRLHFDAHHAADGD